MNNIKSAYMSMIESDINEMANAYQEHTGKKGIFYFSNKSEIKNKQAHSLGRVKFFKDGVSYMTTIKPDKGGRYVLVKPTQAEDTRITNWLMKFVELNYSILWEYWDADDIMKINSDDTKKKFKKV